MEEIILHIPHFEELAFRKKLYCDEQCECVKTDFSEGKWEAWYKKWIKNPQKRFYAFLMKRDGTFVGDVNFHWDTDFGCYMLGVVVSKDFQGKGYAQQGLKLLIEEAKEQRITSLNNLFPREREGALHIHKKLGFCEVKKLSNEENVFLRLKI